MGLSDTLGFGEYAPDASAGYVPGADDMRRRYLEGEEEAKKRQGALMDTGQSDQFRQQQMSLAQALAAQASGHGPSLAQGQLRQATDRSLAQALALQASQRGMGSRTAARDVANQHAAISQQAAADSSQLALTEQMQARNALGQVLAGGRGQDIAVAGSNQQAEMQQRQMNDQMVQHYLSLGLTLAQAQQQAAMEMEKLKAQSYEASQGRRSEFLGNLASAGASLAGVIANKP